MEGSSFQFESTCWQAPSYNVDSPNMAFLGVCHAGWQLQSGHLSAKVPDNHMPVCAMTLEHDQSASQENAPYTMRTARRLLTEAHQTTFPELRQLGRNATVMDMILDHRLLVKVADLPADGRHRSPVLRNHAPRCQADVDAYWARQEEREFVSPAASKNIEPPISAERSTMAWPPNLDGDEVWDCAS